MRVDLKKFVFLGAEQDKQAFFKKAQEAGIIHFIENDKIEKNPHHSVDDYSKAIKILRGLPPLPQEELDADLAHGLALKIIQSKERLNQLEEELRLNRLEIARIQIYGNFSIEDIRYIEDKSGRVIQYFFGKEGTAHKENLPETLIYVGTEFGLDYFISINTVPVQYPGMGELKIEHSLQALHQRQKTLDREIHEIEARLKGYAKYNQFLHQALVQLLNYQSLDEAQKMTLAPIEGDLFAIQGWVPVNKLEQLGQLVKELNVYHEQIEVESADIIPTHLENEGAGRIGEDLVHIYDTPSPTDKDPSLWVLAWFTFFFAMIIGDAGYGLVFLASALYVKYKYKKFNALGSRVWKLVMILSFSCLLWGLMATSFFGISFSMDSPIRKISLMNWLVEKKAAYHFERKDATYQEWIKKDPELTKAADGRQFLLASQVKEKNGSISYPMYNKFYDQILMELALLVGVIHIIISFIRYLDRNWSGIGWIAFMIGAYLYLPNYLEGTSILNFVFNFGPEAVEWAGIELMIGGLALSMILAIIKNKLYGVLELMNLIQIFADVLSYLRLYALALAGAMVASTINEFSGSVTFVVGAVLFILGHLTNIGLSIMSGVIHGLRLNFLEWYHYSFEGGGKRFNPLRLLKFE